MNKETVIYGRKQNTEKWQEEVLCAVGRILTEEEINKVKQAASVDGYAHFRIWEFKGDAPNFTSAIS